LSMNAARIAKRRSWTIVDKGKKVYCPECGRWMFEEDTIGGTCDECYEKQVAKIERFPRKKAFDDDWKVG
jgi:RNase P subunit RPR2